MNIFFYIIIFIIGIVFGSFYTLAVYRIPKKQDITHTHSYCPNCKHKLGFWDLIPVFSYIFLGGKCRYCKQKIRPRYLILEVLSGLAFVGFAYLLGLNIYNLDKIAICEYVFFALYFTFVVLMAGIDKEYRKINRPVLRYGVVISIMYILYLCIIEKTSMYKYNIYYTVILFILVLIDTIKLLKNKKDESYTLGVLITLNIMALFTAEYVTINTAITTLLLIAITILCDKLNAKKAEKLNKEPAKEKDTKDNKIKETHYAENVKIGFYLGVTNIVYLAYTLILLKIM